MSDKTDLELVREHLKESRGYFGNCPTPLAALDRLEASLAHLDGKRREGRGLLQRMVKRVRAGYAVAGGATPLARLTDQVDDYLQRTHDPKDILR